MPRQRIIDGVFLSPIAEAVDAVAHAALTGLSANPKTLPPWLFYDEVGSPLFERITELPEYYLTRTERAILAAQADEILDTLGADATFVELGAGTATKTGLLLAAATRRQTSVLYQPIDVSASALDQACEHLAAGLPGLIVRPQIANYVTDPIRIGHEPHRKVLALYIGSSIGNFSPNEARGVLANLRSQLLPGDHLLLGTDLAPSPQKSVASLIAAYDDAQGVTAAFNLNILARLNRELAADFRLDRFAHEARWNATECRMEMHLVSTCAQIVSLPANSASPARTVRFTAGESIHTENSYKFTAESLRALLSPCFRPVRSFRDSDDRFAVTLAEAV